MDYLKKAATLAPDEAHYSYVYGIGLNSMQRPGEAISFLENALKIHPYDQEILYALTTLNIEQANAEKAEKYARRLVESYPEDPNYQNILQTLQNLK